MTFIEYYLDSSGVNTLINRQYFCLANSTKESISVQGSSIITPTGSAYIKATALVFYLNGTGTQYTVEQVVGNATAIIMVKI
jgi:hypothetical protein